MNETSLNRNNFSNKEKFNPKKQATFVEKLNIKSKKNAILEFLTEYFFKFSDDKIIDHEDDLDSLVYGIEVKLMSSSDARTNVIFLSDNMQTNLILIDKNNKNCLQIDILKVREISIGHNRGIFSKIKDHNKKLIQKLKENLSVTLHFLKSNSINLYFTEIDLLNKFLSGLFYLLKTNIDEKEKIPRIYYYAKKLWNKYDKDHSNQLDLDEFSNFIRDMHMNLNGVKFKTIEEIRNLFSKIDRDCSGKIEFEEFNLYYEELLSGNEFRENFNQYANGKNYMDTKDLVEFMVQEQKETIFSVQDAIKIILSNSNQITKTTNSQKFNPDNLKMTIREFKNFVWDIKFFNIYDWDSINEQQDMTRPLNEYFIYSSHNTYLTNHQLYGESSVEMYNFAVRNGCRLVELDCWDGDFEPIITHGHTLTSNIFLRDVLKNLKENSFKISPYPVILSIEMHCSSEQQKIMATMFKEILKDLYILDDNNPPELYPSPEELKFKFIIKEGREKITYPSSKTGNTNYQSEDANIILNSENRLLCQDQDELYDLEIPEEKSVNEQFEIYQSPSIKKSTHSIIKNPPNGKDSNVIFNKCITNENEDDDYQFRNQYRMKYVLSSIRETDNDGSSECLNLAIVSKNLTKQSTILKMDTKEGPGSYHYNSSRDIGEYVVLSSTQAVKNKQFNSTTNNKNKIPKEKKKKEKIVKEIQELVGLTKTKLDWKKINLSGEYNIWDCPSIKESIIIDMHKLFDMRKNIANFCNNSFIKVYPSGKRIDSSNIDPVKSWICGVQIAALNLQSLQEDQILINTVFFKINKNSGYILKPDFLRGGSAPYERKYDKPRLKISLKIISALMLDFCQNNKSNDISINCYLIGSWEDDNLNGKFHSKKYKNNLINQIFDDEIYIFDIYEPKLSFIIIKLISHGSSNLARCCIPISIMKEGIRAVPFYNDQCQEIPDSQLMVKINISTV